MRTFNWLISLASLVATISSSIAADDSNAITQEPYLWRNVTVGAGGFIPGIVFSRVEKGLVYLRSDMGGCYRWDDPEKQWIPLQDSMGESSYFGGESIAPDPIDPNTVYVAAGMYRGDPSAILRSHDRGKTWDVFPVTFRMGGNEDGRGVGERLAIDPNDNTILFFGSRHDGLWRSTDSGQSWNKVVGFPLKGRGLPRDNQPTNTGLSFVVFNPTSGARGRATATIFVGSADPGTHHLFRSDDAGKSWTAVPGGPGPAMLPAQGQIDDDRILYITYGTGTGPNGVDDGAVMKLDTSTGKWTDISPEKGPNKLKGGYCGLSLDRLRPGTLGVTTMNRWKPVDTVWRTTDGGKTWTDIMDKSERDVHVSPFLLWGIDKAKLGWWMAAFAIDPFDSNHAVYSTGATIYASNDFANVSAGQPTHWYPWIKGIEQTAVVSLTSPADGPHLLSGFGDIGGFVQDDFSISPPAGMYENPQFASTVTLDYAGERPSVIVRSGNPNENQAAMGYSIDGGRSWKPLTFPASLGHQRAGDAHPAVAVSADGAVFMAMTPVPIITRDKGVTWSEAKGLPLGLRPIADRVDPQTFYALDFRHGSLLVSSDAGANFKIQHPKGLPAGIKPDEPTWHEGPWPLVATLGKPHDLWLVTHRGLYHSPDGGNTYSRAPGAIQAEMLSFGKAPDGKDYPSIFAVGTLSGLKAIWRSDDQAKSWVRVNDDQHQYGTRYRCIAGDPRIFGRVYVGTDGRGLFYAQAAGLNP